MNPNKLKAKLVEKGINVDGFADQIGMDRSTLYRKLANFEKITIGDATRMKSALGLSGKDATDIFLT